MTPEEETKFDIKVFKTLLLIVLIPIGALIFRMRGGFGIKLPRPIEQAMYASLWVVAAYFFIPSFIIEFLDTHIYKWFEFESNYTKEGISVLNLIATTIMILKGHGRNMDLGHANEAFPDAKPEWYEFTILWLEKKMNPYWYDVLGITVSGVTYGIPSTIITLNPLFLLVGALKGPAYMLGWSWFDGTTFGEWMTGALQWAGLAALLGIAINQSNEEQKENE